MDRRMYIALPAFVTVISLFFCKSGASTANSTVYEELVEHGLPVGLLPRTVVDYKLQMNGKFMVRLEGECAFTLRKTYHVTYGSTVSGLLSYGAINQLSGVSVEVWWFSMSVNGIYLSGNELLFQVGFMSTKFPLSSFAESPVCGGELPTLSSALRK